MHQDENKIKKQIKENINLLIENGEVEKAKTLINEYRKMIPNDIDIYSIDAVIAIMQGNLKMAEEVIQDGLKVDDNNFDLLYNLAYVCQQKGEYNRADRKSVV